MKKILLLFLLSSSFIFAQMPNIEGVWLNNSKPYSGTIDKAQIRLKINISEQNKKNDQQYFVAGNSLVNGDNASKFEGVMTITKYRDGKKRSSVYGEYEFAEEPAGSHSGVFKGKFVYTFFWNKKLQKIERQYVEFTGEWTSYDGKLNYKTNWTNQIKTP